MQADKTKFWSSYSSRTDLKKYGDASLLLFASQLKFTIEDIDTFATNSLTEGSSDKKADLIHIDKESGLVVIAQAYMSKDLSKTEAPAKKASDLNTAVSWLLNRNFKELPLSIQSHAKEIQELLKTKQLKSLNIWYVHNLPESKNVKNELDNVAHTAKSILDSIYNIKDLEISTIEVGTTMIEEWYKSIVIPILVNDKFELSNQRGYLLKEDDWNAFITAVPAAWIYDLFKKYSTNLFSANIRDYLGSRISDANINNGIKDTGENDPQHFWVYNNGITAIVNKFEYDEKKNILILEGISIVNGAQTTGAIGSLSISPDQKASVQIRFIECTTQKTIQNIVRFNNSQNKVNASDFRSNDLIQKRLRKEFESIKDAEYFGRRGGHEDTIKRRPNLLAAETVGQALAAFHREPAIAYHQKTKIWELDVLYSRFFNENTSAKHIMMTYSLLKAVESKKEDIIIKSNCGTLTELEEDQLKFFRLRGSTFLLSSAIARCLETFLTKPIPLLFNLYFKSNYSPDEAMNKWKEIIDISCSFTNSLIDGISDGLQNTDKVNNAIKQFQSLIDSTKKANAETYHNFASLIN